MSKISQDYSPAIEGNLLTGWRYRAVIITLLLGAAGYLALSAWVGWEEMAGALAQFGWLGIMVALSLTLLSLSARVMRWQLYLASLEISQPLMSRMWLST